MSAPHGVVFTLHRAGPMEWVAHSTGQVALEVRLRLESFLFGLSIHLGFSGLSGHCFILILF